MTLYLLGPLHPVSFSCSLVSQHLIRSFLTNIWRTLLWPFLFWVEAKKVKQQLKCCMTKRNRYGFWTWKVSRARWVFLRTTSSWKRHPRVTDLERKRDVTSRLLCLLGTDQSCCFLAVGWSFDKKRTLLMVDVGVFSYYLSESWRFSHISHDCSILQRRQIQSSRGYISYRQLL